MPKLKLVFTPNELPNEAAKLLRNGFCVNDDPDYLWFDTTAILDGIAEGRFPGVTYEPGMETIPAAWWKLMKFSPKVERQIKAHLKKDEDAAVEFCW